MKNITPHGTKHLWTYINDYIEGKIFEREAKAKIGCCFEERRFIYQPSGIEVLKAVYPGLRYKSVK